MSLLLVAVAGPAAGALATLLGLPALLRRAGHLAGLAAAVAVLARAVRDGSFGAAGLTADPLRAGIAVAIGAVALAAALARDEPAAPRRAGAVAAGDLAVAASIGSVLAAHLATAGGFLLVTTAGIAVAAHAARARDAWRVVLVLAATDALAIVGLATMAGAGARVPPETAGAGAWLLAAAALGRATMAGAPRWSEAWVCDPAAPRAAILGAARAQGLLLAIWVARADGAAPEAMTIAAALAAAGSAGRAARWRSWSAALAATAALAIVGLGTGTETGLVAAILTAAGLAAATIVRVTGERTAIAPSLGAAGLGATVAGVALVAGDAAARAAVDHPFLLVAIPATAAALWLAVAGGAGFGEGSASGLAVVPAGIGLGIAASLSLLPGTVGERVAAGAVRSITAAAPLSPGAPALTDRLGLLMAMAGLAVAIAVATPAGSPPALEPAAGGPPPHPRSVRAAIVPAAVALIALFVLIVSGADRGWL